MAWLIVFLFLLPQQVLAEPIQIQADRIARDAKGNVTAIGGVRVQRGEETLYADWLRFEPEKHCLQAKGDVRIESPDGVILAESGQLDTKSRQGELRDAELTLPGGERMKAERIVRLDSLRYQAYTIEYTTCPADAQAWRLTASQATLDQGEGILKAKHARFEFGALPLLYAPYWQQAIRRKSGFLIPQASSSKRRGTELALPYYFAPAENWDLTATPRWMSARGIRPELEFRYASRQLGTGTFFGEWFYDKLLKRERSRWKADVASQLPASMQLKIRADHVSDHDYLADFAHQGSEANKRYLRSNASIARAGSLIDWQVTAIHTQNLALGSNATTLQVLPRLMAKVHVPDPSPHLRIGFEQETTRYVRRIGLEGWRADFYPFLESPWSWHAGAIKGNLKLGSHHTQYWVGERAIRKRHLRRYARTSVELTARGQAEFERISKDGLFRHSIIPILAYHHTHVERQQSFPNFDSGFSQFTISTLLDANRYSGRDRIERTHRIAFMLDNLWQSKATPHSPAATLATLRVGSAYNLRTNGRSRSFENIFAETEVFPFSAMRLTASAQYNPYQRIWPLISGGLSWQSNKGHRLSIDYHLVESSFAHPGTQTFLIDGKTKVSHRWQAHARWYYDTVLKLTQQAAFGMTYTHPCWTVDVEAYRIFRPSGSTAASDFGIRLLLNFKGLGSVGGKG